MTKASLVVSALALAAGTAGAQPGNAPPQEAPQPQPQPQPEQPPPPPPPLNPPYGLPQPPPDRQGGYGHLGPVDLDSVIAKVGAEMPTIQTVAKGTLRRARRAVSFGPTVGYWIGPVPAQDTFEHAITFGLALEVFKVPILPDKETIKGLILERVKAKVKEQLFARLSGRQADPIAAEAMIKQIYAEVRAEVLGLENVRPKTMERPRFSLALEANRMFRSEAWMPRLRAGVGIWKFTLGGSFGVAFTDRVGIVTGPELVLHFLISDKPRASVVDVFARMDFEVRNRDTNTDQIVFGVRFLLDAI